MLRRKYNDLITWFIWLGRSYIAWTNYYHLPKKIVPDKDDSIHQWLLFLCEYGCKNPKNISLLGFDNTLHEIWFSDGECIYMNYVVFSRMRNEIQSFQVTLHTSPRKRFILFEQQKHTHHKVHPWILYTIEETLRKIQ